MTDQDRDTLQLQRIVDAERPHPYGPDVAALLTAGHRRLRRRRAATGVAASLAVVAAVAAPAYVVGNGPGESTTNTGGVATSPTNEPGTNRTAGCGVLLCVDPTEAVPEDGELIGEPWVLGEPADGVEEVAYATQTNGFDLATGEPGMVDALMLGYRQDGKLHRMAATVQPGSDGASPAGKTVSMWSSDGRLGERDSDVFIVVGYVDGTPDEITWSTPDGAGGAVDGMDTSTVPGRTVFHLALPRPEGTDRAGESRVQKSGDEVILGGGQESFRPDITFHSSDGWSCSLKDCGSVG